MTPEYLEELADFVDPDKLWRVSPLQRHTLTPEQRKRCDAAVALRRHAGDERDLKRCLAQKCSWLITPLEDHSTARRTISTPPDHERLRPKRRPTQPGLTHEDML